MMLFLFLFSFLFYCIGGQIGMQVGRYINTDVPQMEKKGSDIVHMRFWLEIKRDRTLFVEK